MLLKIAAVLAAIPMALGTVVAATGVVVVDVQPGPDDPRIIVPVPLILAQAAASLSPARIDLKLDRHLDRVRPYLPAAQEMVEAIAAGPDAVLVEVEDGDEHVRIGKVGSVLQVRVTGEDENVSVDVPFDVVREALRQARHGRISLGDIVAALRQARFTKLVEVRDGDERVRITVW